MLLDVFDQNDIAEKIQSSFRYFIFHSLHEVGGKLKIIHVYTLHLTPLIESSVTVNRCQEIKAGLVGQNDVC